MTWNPLSKTKSQVLIFAAAIWLAPWASSPAFGWSVEDKTGTLGFGVIEAEQDTALSIDYARRIVGDEIVRGVVIAVANWDDIGEHEGTYFRLRSEYFVEFAESRDSIAISSEIKLQEGLYIIIFGPITGQTHGSPVDPHFMLSFSNTDGNVNVISKWAGDVSVFNERQGSIQAGEPGLRGKVSAVWDEKAIEALDLFDIFPNAKLVTQFGATNPRME